MGLFLLAIIKSYSDYFKSPNIFCNKDKYKPTLEKFTYGK